MNVLTPPHANLIGLKSSTVLFEGTLEMAQNHSRFTSRLRVIALIKNKPMQREKVKVICVMDVYRNIYLLYFLRVFPICRRY